MYRQVIASRLFILVLLLAVLGPTSSCALFGLGGGGDDVKHNRNYSVSAPAAWKKIDSDDSDQAYRLPSGNIVEMTSSCNRDTREPLEWMTRHLLIGDRGTNIVQREKLVVDGKEGMFSEVETTLEGKPFRLNLFVLPSHGCIFDFSLVSPRNISQNETHEFLSFVKSFKYGKN